MFIPVNFQTVGAKRAEYRVKTNRMTPYNVCGWFPDTGQTYTLNNLQNVMPC